jgi:DNA-binding LacI/PurR family transcriptional regulator
MAAGARRVRRVTITDIARHAGVSKGAVSYALNGQPGVSDATRSRILTIANELGWYPNRAARSLSAARADACGLVIARPSRMLALEPFFMEFIAGVEAEFSARSVALTIQLVRDLDEEVEIYRRWWAERRVDGVMLVDLRVDDPRLAEVARLGLPAVLVGGPVEGGEVPCVWHDERGTIAAVVRYLAALGHGHIARVEGVNEFVHTRLRTAAFLEIAQELGLETEVIGTDYTPESSARATRMLLSRRNVPTAIVYDSDILAVTGLGVAHQMGFVVPDDVSIVAGDDSLICEVVHPPLTAVTRDVVAYGSAAARRLLQEVDGEASGDVETPSGALTVRATTDRLRAGPPRGRYTATGSAIRSRYQ